MAEEEHYRRLYRRLYENAALFGMGSTVVYTALGAALGGRSGAYVGACLGAATVLFMLGSAKTKVAEIKERLRRGKDISDLFQSKTIKYISWNNNGLKAAKFD